MNAVFNVNKPAGMTSNDVVAVMRKILNMKRVGHGGTLDPDATGVLPVFTGTATRLLEFAVNGTKEYVAEFELGKQTDTGDISGEIVGTQSVPDLDVEFVKNILQKFTGVQKQIPPMYSAIKIHGQKLYQLARRGEEVERKPRDIEIFALELLEWNPPCFKVRVQCSKGTYIRVLGEDIAKALGTVGTLKTLQRTKVAGFTIEDAHTLTEIKENYLACSQKPIDVVQLEQLKTTPKQAYRITSGVPTTIRGVKNGRYAVLSPVGDFLAVAVAEQEIVKAEKVLEFYADSETIK